MSAMSTVRARERCVDGGERRDAMGRETIGAAGRRARGAATARRETAAKDARRLTNDGNADLYDDR
jgi:hypothetical protein